MKKPLIFKKITDKKNHVQEKYKIWKREQRHFKKMARLETNKQDICFCKFSSVLSERRNVKDINS